MKNLFAEGSPCSDTKFESEHKSEVWRLLIKTIKAQWTVEDGVDVSKGR